MCIIDKYKNMNGSTIINNFFNQKNYTKGFINNSDKDSYLNLTFRYLQNNPNPTNNPTDSNNIRGPILSFCIYF